jgi:hypothetical protein
LIAYSTNGATGLNMASMYKKTNKKIADLRIKIIFFAKVSFIKTLNNKKEAIICGF